MSKRKETLEIEEKLHQMCKKRRIYGCEEITIGFYNSGHGDEIVDFCTMDSKGIIRCYEIKVTLPDLKSKAKKSWYGHYNYLFVTPELYQKIENELDAYIPNYVGVALPCESSWSDGVQIVRSAKKQPLSEKQRLLMTESMVRSMHYKIQKCRDSVNLHKMSELRKEIRRLNKDNTKYQKEVANLRFLMSKIERIIRHYYDVEIDLEHFVEQFEHAKVLLPEKIKLKLTERGYKMNDIIREEQENQK